MDIKTSRFVTSVAKSEDLKDFNLDEVAVAGRSNVGKSTFINYITGRKALAKTSATPGKTRMVNYFAINEALDYAFMLVDLPGYGYAVNLSEDEKRRWDKLMGAYLTGSERLKHVLVLMDIRREPSKLDIHMIEYLNLNIVPFTVVLTKADKLSKSAALRQKKAIASSLKLGIDNLIVTSSLNKQGGDEIKQLIEEKLFPVI
ncbi:MAG: ribosome biogenesis GTP-binding protein YihA/YsxC [Clostridia bacterium]|nr:ribosome biogenesis GTP-binding protein YihA/YsxC [Clostridia bacterium]